MQKALTKQEQRQANFPIWGIILVFSFFYFFPKNNSLTDIFSIGSFLALLLTMHFLQLHLKMTKYNSIIIFTFPIIIISSINITIYILIVNNLGEFNEINTLSSLALSFMLCVIFFISKEVMDKIKTEENIIILSIIFAGVSTSIATDSLFGIIAGLLSAFGIIGFLNHYKNKNFNNSYKVLLVYLLAFIFVSTHIYSFSDFTVIKNSDGKVLKILEKGESVVNINNSNYEELYDVKTWNEKKFFTGYNKQNAEISISAIMDPSLVKQNKDESLLKEMEKFDSVTRSDIDEFIKEVGYINAESIKQAFEGVFPNLYFDVSVTYY